jgi:hypothetical protein
MSTRFLAAAALSALILLAISPPASAQGFGKNKVQYESLDWSVLETDLRLHYYAAEESLARRLAAFANTCVVFDGRFSISAEDPDLALLGPSSLPADQRDARPGVGGNGRTHRADQGTGAHPAHRIARAPRVGDAARAHARLHAREDRARDARPPPHPELSAAAVVHGRARGVLRTPGMPTPRGFATRCSPTRRNRSRGATRSPAPC